MRPMGFFKIRTKQYIYVMHYFSDFFSIYSAPDPLFLYVLLWLEFGLFIVFLCNYKQYYVNVDFFFRVCLLLVEVFLPLLLPLLLVLSYTGARNHLSNYHTHFIMDLSVPIYVHAIYKMSIFILELVMRSADRKISGLWKMKRQLPQIYSVRTSFFLFRTIEELL